MKDIKIILGMLVSILIPLYIFSKLTSNIAFPNLNGINSINKNYNLNLPINEKNLNVYQTNTIDIILFEKLIYNESIDDNKITSELNNHDKNLLEEKLNIIYNGLDTKDASKYKENFDYDYQNEEEVYFYSNTKRDRETLLIYNPKEKIIYHLSNAKFE